MVFVLVIECTQWCLSMMIDWWLKVSYSIFNHSRYAFKAEHFHKNLVIYITASCTWYQGQKHRQDNDESGYFHDDGHSQVFKTL